MIPSRCAPASQPNNPATMPISLSVVLVLVVLAATTRSMPPGRKHRHPLTFSRVVIPVVLGRVPVSVRSLGGAARGRIATGKRRRRQKQHHPYQQYSTTTAPWRDASGNEPLPETIRTDGLLLLVLLVVPPHQGHVQRLCCAVLCCAVLLSALLLMNSHGNTGSCCCCCDTTRIRIIAVLVGLLRNTY